MKENLRRGLILGLGEAAVLSLWIIFAVEFLEDNALAEYNASLLEAVAAYSVGGVTGGVLAGLVYPLRKYALGSVMVGFLLAAPAAVGIIVVTTPKQEMWTIGGIPGALIAAALVGGLVGLQIWSEDEWYGD